MTRFRNLKDVSDEIEKTSHYLVKQLANLTKGNYSLLIKKKGEIVSCVEIKCLNEQKSVGDEK